MGGKQLYAINIIDYTLVALFAIMGVGLAPFRAWDTYNMFHIARYHHMTWKIRRNRRLPTLPNKNDLPDLRKEDAELGSEQMKDADYVVLSPTQQATLQKHIYRFCRSHTFYKPHETQTHYAFPISYLIAIVTLLDFHSIFQIALGATTWGINYNHRPGALTAVILCCSICCNLAAGILISIGDHKTRKKDVLERLSRQELTGLAMEKIERRRHKDHDRSDELSGDEMANRSSSERTRMSPAPQSGPSVDRTAQDHREMDQAQVDPVSCDNRRVHVVLSPPDVVGGQALAAAVPDSQDHTIPMSNS